MTKLILSTLNSWFLTYPLPPQISFSFILLHNFKLLCVQVKKIDISFASFIFLMFTIGKFNQLYLWTIFRKLLLTTSNITTLALSLLTGTMPTASCFHSVSYTLFSAQSQSNFSNHKLCHVYPPKNSPEALLELPNSILPLLFPPS